jgi:hypothetical protein
MRVDFDRPRQFANGAFGIVRAVKRHALLMMGGRGGVVLREQWDEGTDHQTCTRQTGSRNRSRQAQHAHNTLNLIAG